MPHARSNLIKKCVYALLAIMATIALTITWHHATTSAHAEQHREFIADVALAKVNWQRPYVANVTNRQSLFYSGYQLVRQVTVTYVSTAGRPVSRDVLLPADQAELNQIQIWFNRGSVSDVFATSLDSKVAPWDSITAPYYDGANTISQAFRIWFATPLAGVFWLMFMLSFVSLHVIRWLLRHNKRYILSRWYSGTNMHR